MDSFISTMGCPLSTCLSKVILAGEKSCGRLARAEAATGRVSALAFGGKLYKPPRNGTRQVFAVSRGIAEKLPRLESVAVISVTAPGRPLAILDGFKQVLRLSFADVDFMNPEISPRAKEKLKAAFRPEQAETIREFVERLPGGVVTVVVRCEGGYSRSCAIALGLHRLYGYETDTKHLAEANPSVLCVLMLSGP